MNLSVVKNVFLNRFPNQLHFLLSHKSEIMTGIGIISGVATTAVACRATLKMVDVVDVVKANLTGIQLAKNHAEEFDDPDSYTEEDARSDTIKVYAQAVGKAGRLYGPVVLLGAVSIGCIIGGHNVLRKENAALAAAFTGVTEAFRRYRDRIESTYGKDKETEFYLGAEKVAIETTGENGKTKKESILVVNPNDVSQYARFFDEQNPQFSKDPAKNLMFLRSQQNWANEKLKDRGHLFLNEVYDMLGLPRSQAGQYVGWVEGHGDDFVDFGLYLGVHQATNDFVNGFRERVLLDFNVDGAIDDIFMEKRFGQKLLDPRA